MIEILFLTGVVLQAYRYLFQHITSLFRHHESVGYAVILAFGVLCAMFYKSAMPEGYTTLLDGMFTTGMVVGVLFAIAWGLFTFETARKLSITVLIITNLVTTWQVLTMSPPLFWTYLVWGSWILVIVGIVPKLRLVSIVQSMQYLWFLIMLVSFGVILFYPMTQVFEPSPYEALIYGSLLLSIAASGMFVYKLLLTLGSTMLNPTTTNITYLQCMNKMLFVDTAISTSDIFIVVSSTLVVLADVLHISLPLSTFELLLSILIFFSVFPSLTERKLLSKLTYTAL